MKNRESNNVFLDKVSIVLFGFSIIFSLVMFIGRFNFLAVIAVALSIIISLVVLLKFLISKKIFIFDLLSFSTIMGATLLLFVIFGQDPFLKRFFYNITLTGIPITVVFLAYFFHSKWKFRHTFLFTAVFLSISVLSTSIYMLTLGVRIKPTTTSLQKGHDEYLNEIRSSYRVLEDNPNVFIILMDDMAYSDLSCYSYLGRENATIKTPVIDALADDGVIFENFYACAPVCSPSRFGMLTGRYSVRGHLDNVIFPTEVSLHPFGDTRLVNPFQFTHNVDGILGDEITFAEVMQNMGYNTGIFGKWNLGDYGEYLPTNQGFDYFFGSYYVNDMTPYNMVREMNGESEEVINHYDLIDQSETTKILTSEIERYITKSIDNKEKFLAYYTTPWPHFPIFSGEKHNTTDDTYIHCIEELDTYLGHIIDLLKDKGVYDDTLIIFTSDNGPGREGVTGALRGRKGTTFDGGQKVPFIATYPNARLGKGEAFENGNVITAQTMNIDIFPTLLDYIGVDIQPKDRIIDGISLYDLMQGNADGDTDIHDMLFHIHRGKVQGVQMPIEVDGKIYHFKYYKNVWTENAAFFNQFYKNYLFNLTTDPAEGYNVEPANPEIAIKLSNYLQNFINSLKENKRGINQDYYKK